MASLQIKFAHLLFLTVLASELSSVAAQCGSDTCRQFATVNRQCRILNRSRKCETVRCNGSKWRCQRKGSGVPSYAGFKLIAEFTWTIDEIDMDTSVEILHKSEGFDCAGSKYISFTGDDIDDGGFEKYTINIGQAAIENKRQSIFVTFKAHWYNRVSFAPASLFVYLVNGNGRRVVNVPPLFIRPGADAENTCSPVIVATADVQLTGTPKITLMERIPTKLELIANITGSSDLVTSATYAGDTTGPTCGSTAKYITWNSDVSTTTKTDSYVVEVSNAKKDGVLGSNTVAKFNSGFRGGTTGKVATINLYLQDGYGRRYPVVYEKRVVKPQLASDACPTKEIAKAAVTNSNSKVSLDASF